jgi:NitT/TauT family transport system substrate-binding protein
MRTRVWSLIAVALALGCAASAETAAKDLPRKVRMSWSRHLSYGPLYIAQAEGFFEQEGLEFEPVMAMRPEETLVALVTGDIDVRPGPLDAGFLSSIAQGAPVKVTAGMAVLNQGCTYFGIIVRPGLDTAGKSNIKRMRASQDGASRYIVSNMLAQRNVDIRNLETVRLPEAVYGMSLEQRTIDAVAVSEPGLTRLSKIGKLWLSGEDALPGFQWGVLAFGERLLVRERETGLRFMRAYQRGVEQYEQGKTDRNVAIIAEATGETPEMTRETCWPDFSPASRLDWKSIADFQAWANREGLMEYTLTPEQAYDSAFVTSVARERSRTP